MKLSVNILTWNNISTLPTTLEILKDELKDLDHEIIVVDNGSDDGCEKLATIANEYNLGISVGKNQGIEASNGEFILLLDGDIIPVPESVSLLLDWLEFNPSAEAIGFHPNKWTNQKNRHGQLHHEEFCYELYNPEIINRVCLYFGLFRARVFDKIRLSEDAVLSGCGYGWEDTDLYMQMKANGIDQWAAGINSASGKYYHEINSSIRNMGHDKYMSSSLERSKWFKQKWEKQNVG